MTDQERRRRWQLERWISLVRLIALPWGGGRGRVLQRVPVPTVRGRRGSGDCGADDRCGLVLPRRTARRAGPSPAGVLLRRSCLRHGGDLGVRVRLHVRIRDADPAAPLLSGRRGRASLRPARRTGDARGAGADSRGNRVVAERPFRSSGLRARPHHVPAWPPVRHGRDHRLARQPSRARDGRRPGTRLRGRGSSRPPRASRRSPRRRQPMRPGPGVIARDRGGVSRVHPRAPRADSIRPDGDHPRRRRRRPRDRGGRRRGRDGLSARNAPAGSGVPPVRSDEERAGRLPEGHGRAEVPRGGGLRGARLALPARRAAFRRPKKRRHDLPRPR